MKYISEFRDSALAQGLISDICGKSKQKVRLMEFCGGHTVAIFKYGIRQALPANIELVSGPGCPVCVTANEDIDRAIWLSQQPGVITTTFGDLVRVPGSSSSLHIERSKGADVRIVYSTLDALEIASPAQAVEDLDDGLLPFADDGNGKSCPAPARTP